MLTVRFQLVESGPSRQRDRPRVNKGQKSKTLAAAKKIALFSSFVRGTHVMALAFDFFRSGAKAASSGRINEKTPAGIRMAILQRSAKSLHGFENDRSWTAVGVLPARPHPVIEGNYPG